MLIRFHPYIVCDIFWNLKDKHSTNYCLFCIVHVICDIFGGSLELPMWLMDGFLVTSFGRWWGAVRIHVSHVQLSYTVHRTR